jgi:selenocysteine-specific elongation factor
LIQVSSDVVFRKSDYEMMLRRIRAKLSDGGTMTVAEVRDLFGTSRKFALALMEHLDAIGITIREGDIRRLVD